MRALLVTLFIALLGIFPARAADQAPGFTLRDINGKQASLSDFSGQVVLISFWASWCTPCQAEMPHLERFYQTYREKGFTVLSINTDDARSSSQVKPLVKSKGLTFPVLLDKETAVVALYNPAKTLPYGVLIDRSGAIAQVFQGYTPGEEVHVEEAIKVALGLAGPPPAEAPPAQPAPEPAPVE
ncbi:MAG: TlpA disulfide reductase family protein [Pseudomonadota bacterium]